MPPLKVAGEVQTAKGAADHQEADRLRNEGKTSEADKKDAEGTLHDAQAKAFNEAETGCKKAADAATDQGEGAPPSAPSPAKPPEKTEEEKKAAETPPPTPAPVVQNTPAPQAKPDPAQQDLLAKIDGLKPEPSRSPGPSQATLDTDARIAALKTQEANQMADHVQTIIDQRNAVRAPGNRVGETVSVAAAQPAKPTVAEQLVSFDQRKKAGRAMLDNGVKAALEN